MWRREFPHHHGQHLHSIGGVLVIDFRPDLFLNLCMVAGPELCLYSESIHQVDSDIPIIFGLKGRFWDHQAVLFEQNLSDLLSIHFLLFFLEQI